MVMPTTSRSLRAKTNVDQLVRRRHAYAPSPVRHIFGKLGSCPHFSVLLCHGMGQATMEEQVKADFFLPGLPCTAEDILTLDAKFMAVHHVPAGN